MSSRLNEVVEALIEGIRGVLTEKGVTLEEYRAAVNHLKQTAAAGELPLSSTTAAKSVRTPTAATRCAAPCRCPTRYPTKAPTGSLLRMLGGHTWRPAHIHFKVSGVGYHPITLQAYFEGGKWLENDCCSGKCTAGQNIIPRKVEDGVRIMDVDIVMEKAVAKAA